MRALKRLILLLVAAGIFLPAAEAWPKKKADYRYKVPKLKYKKPQIKSRKIKGHTVHH